MSAEAQFRERAEFQVNSYVTSYQRAPSVALDGNKRFLVVWEGMGEGDA